MNSRYQGSPGATHRSSPKISQATPSSKAVNPSYRTMAMLWTFRLGSRLLLGETAELADSSRTVSILPLSETSCLAHHWGVTTSTILQKIASGPNSHLTAVERRQRREALRSLRRQTDGS